MAFRPRTVILVVCVVGQVIGLAIFLKGFFPTKAAIPGYATFKNLPAKPTPSSDGWKRRDYEGDSFGEYLFQTGVSQNKEADVPEDNGEYGPPVPATFGKVVVMLIDGMRADFVLGSRGPDLMPYTRSLIDKGDTKSFVARAHVPTVTMPRIKAITTGTVPGFIDLVVNLDSKALQEDNIILQMVLNRKKVHLYGDDTWIRMFPGQFHKADGTTSFFVTDYTEVDNNVTRNVEPALKSSDWDAIILHYLGLDHIGHLGGPYSSLVQPKLREMDDIIKRMHEILLVQDSQNALPSLLIICGDHGMSEAGNHGGASIGEVLTPLVFISSAFSGGKGLQDTSVEVHQIDFAATLSLLIGLPIPQNSLGIAIPHALGGSLSTQELLRALQINGHQLMAVHEKNAGKIDEDAKLQLIQAFRLHAKWLHVQQTGVPTQVHHDLGERAIQQYIKALHTMRDRISLSLSQYDMHAMVSGMMLLGLILLVLILEMSGSQSTRPSTHISGALVVFVVCCLATGVVQTGMCNSFSGVNREVLCSQTHSSYILFLAFIAVFSFCAMVLVSTPVGIYMHLLYICRNPSHSLTELCLLAGSILHTYSLASSSFVEEEHQTWYFLTMNLMLGVCISGCIGWMPRLAGASFLCVCCMRLQRSWNQTGVEWLNRPDLGDWFVRPDNKGYLSLLLLVSLCIIYAMFVHDKRKHQPFMAASFIGVFLYRHATGTLGLPLNIPHSPKGILEAWFTYAVILASLLATLCKCLKLLTTDQSSNLDYGAKSSGISSGIIRTVLDDFHSALLMLTLLILRPHNSAVVAILVVLQSCIHGYLLPWLQWKVWVVTLVHVWMGQAAFYAQGNSNNAASLDISAGYVGLEGYSLALAGFLTLVATYAGPLLWLTKLAVYLASHNLERFSSRVEESCLTLALSRALPVAAYTVLATVQRYHLFVWSVFSPKLLYDGVHTSLTCGLILAAQLCVVVMYRTGLMETYKSDLYAR